MSTWESLHDLEHVDHSGNEVSNEFVFPDSFDEVLSWDGADPYFQSIQMFILTTALCGCITIIVVTCLSWIFNCVRKSKEDEKTCCNSNGIWKILKFGPYLVIILCAILIIVSFALSGTLDSTMQDVQDTIDESYDPYQTVLDNGESVDTSLLSMIASCDRIDNKTNNTIIEGTINDIRDSLNKSEAFMSLLLENGESLDWSESGESIDPVREGIVTASIILTAFIALVVIVVFINMRFSAKVSCCGALTAIVSALVVLSMLLLWILGSFQFGLSILFADICADPNSAVIQGLNATDSGTEDTNATFIILKYYMYCDDDHSNNPLINYCNSAYDSMLTVNSTLNQLVTYSAGQSIESDVDSLASEYDSTLDGIVALNASLQCDDINGYYIDLQSYLCDDFIDTWYGLYVIQFIIVGLLLALPVCYSCGQCSSAPSNDARDV